MPGVAAGLVTSNPITSHKTELQLPMGVPASVCNVSSSQGVTASFFSQGLVTTNPQLNTCSEVKYEHADMGTDKQ